MHTYRTTEVTLVEDKAKAPDTAWLENKDLIALASTASPEWVI